MIKTDLEKQEYSEAFLKWQENFDWELRSLGTDIRRFSKVDLECIFIHVMNQREDAAYDAKLEENEACARIAEFWAAHAPIAKNTEPELIADDIRKRVEQEAE